QMRAMARSSKGDRRSLIELKAVDGAYPLYGTVGLAPPQDLAAALARHDGRWGAVVEPALLTRLGLKIGDPIRIGEGELTIRATLEREPDFAGTFVIFGPHVLVSEAALPSTGLLQPGALISHSYRLRLSPGTPLAATLDRIAATWPDAGWRVRDYNHATPTIDRFFGRITLFLTLVALTALL